MNNENFSEAVSILHDLMDCDPLNRKVYDKICLLLFTCYSSMPNQHDNLIKYSTEVIAVDSNYFKALMERGKAYLSVKDYSKAMNDFEAVLKISLIPSNIRKSANELLNDARKNQNETIHAQSKYQKQEKSKEESREKDRNEKEKLEQEKQKLKEENDKLAENLKLAEALNDRGKVQYKASQFKNAINYYDEAIKLCPKVGKYYLNRCACYMSLDDYEKAISNSIKAIDLDPSSWKVDLISIS